jgi:hypothetical protein
MGKFVGQEPHPFIRPGGVSACAKGNIVPYGECAGMQALRHLPGGTSRMEAHPAEIRAEARLEKRPIALF